MKDLNLKYKQWILASLPIVVKIVWEIRRQNYERPKSQI